MDEALRKIPFVVSISYVMDEMTELSDIILPDHTDMERFELVNDMHSKSTAKKFSALLLRQPVILRLYSIPRFIKFPIVNMIWRAGFRVVRLRL